MESDDLDSDDGEVIVNCDQAAVAAQSVKPEINFPGDAYREPEDDKLLADVVEAEKRLTLPSKKPKSITIEHTGEECAYSSDEEEWEKPEPPSMPSLMIQLHDDDEKMKEAAQSKRRELQRFVKDADRFSEGWDAGSLCGRACKAQADYEKKPISGGMGIHEKTRPRETLVDAKPNTYLTKAARNQSKTNVAEEECWLKDDNMCCVDRYLGELTLEKKYTADEKLSPILTKCACDVLNANVMPDFNKSLSQHNMANLKLKPQLDGSVEFQRPTLKPTGRKGTRRPEPIVKRGSNLTIESGDEFAFMHCPPKQRKMTFCCNLTWETLETRDGKTTESCYDTCNVTLAYEKDRFNLTLRRNQSQGNEQRVKITKSVDHDIVEQIMTPSRWGKQWLLDQREKHDSPDPVMVEALVAVADSSFQDPVRLKGIVAAQIGSSYVEGHAFDNGSGTWVEDKDGYKIFATSGTFSILNKNTQLLAYPETMQPNGPSITRTNTRPPIVHI
jgi:hypothetical protein